VELRRTDGAGGTVILDAGTGIRALGQRLTRDAAGEGGTIDLLLSHTHWDHIQGLPFFAPLFGRGNAVRIWGARQEQVTLESVLRDQMKPVVFPVPLDELSAELSVQHVEPGAFTIDGFEVQAMQVRHPGNTLGYVLRPSGGKATLGFVTDNELSGGEYPVAPDWRRRFVEFLHGLDALVHDAMFAPNELARFAGWGHSSTREAVEVGLEAEVSTLVLFHHRPEHDDGMIDALLDQAREAVVECGGTMQVLAAHEGMELNL